MTFPSRRAVRAAVLIGWAVAALTTPTLGAEAPTRYLALGDSLAWGDGALDPSETAYVPLLTEASRRG